MRIHPSTLLAWKWFGGIVILAIFLPITVVHTMELLTASAPPETNKAVTIDKDSATTPNAVVPDSTAITVEMQRRFNELRREILDDRARVVDWWLVVISLVLTFLGIVVAIAGIMGFRRFREIETEARNSIQRVGELEEAAEGHLGEIANMREESVEIIQGMNAKLVAVDPDKVGQAVRNVQNGPSASLLDKTVAQAVSLQRQGERNDAIEKWRAIAHVAEDADNFLAARAWFSVGYLYLYIDPKASISANDRAIGLNPDLAEAFVNRGTAKQQFNQYDDAVADYDEAIRLQQNFAEAYNGRASARLSMELYDESIADCNQAIRLKPDYADAFYNRGTTKVALKRFDEAIDDFNEAVRLNSGYVGAFYNRGRTRVELGHHNEAIADFDEAIRLSPSFAEAYHNRGAEKEALGRHEEAIADFDQAIRLKPGLVEAFYTRAASKVALGRHDMAVADYDEVVRLNPMDAEAIYRRGLCKLALGIEEEARRDFDKALELARNVGNADTANRVENSSRDLDNADGAS